MAESQPEHTIEDIALADGRYPVEAYVFLNRGLSRAVKGTTGDDVVPETDDTLEAQQHVSGQELCEALREEALERWGMMAETVLAKWNVNATIDFGNMVYLLIEHEKMRKTETDSIEDFRDIYDFEGAFDVSDGIDIKQ